MNGASPDGRRTVLKSNSNGCVMKVTKSTLEDLGNYNCSITSEAEDGFDIGYATIKVSQASKSFANDNDILVGILVGIIIILVVVLLVLFIFCQVGNLCELGLRDVEKATEESYRLMDLTDGQKTQASTGNGSVVNQSTDMSYQKENLVSLVLKPIQKKCLISLLVE